MRRRTALVLALLFTIIIFMASYHGAGLRVEDPVWDANGLFAVCWFITLFLLVGVVRIKSNLVLFIVPFIGLFETYKWVHRYIAVHIFRLNPELFNDPYFYAGLVVVPLLIGFNGTWLAVITWLLSDIKRKWKLLLIILLQYIFISIPYVVAFIAVVYTNPL